MSADNWTQCPRCRAIMQKRKKKVHDDIEKTYGNVPLEKYQKLLSEAENLNEELRTLPRTLREDYEIGIYDGGFYIHYSACCSECGYKKKFEHSEVLSF